MLANNFRLTPQNTKVATFDLVLPSGLILCGATLQENSGKRWVGLPSSEYVKADGAKGHVNVVNFVNERTKERFYAEALAAAEEAAAK